MSAHITQTTASHSGAVIDVDALIIGAGFAGMYQLRKLLCAANVS